MFPVKTVTNLDRLVVEFAFELFAFDHLSDRLHKVLIDDIVTLSSDRKHSRLSAHVSQIGAVEAVRQLDHRLIIYNS